MERWNKQAQISQIPLFDDSSLKSHQKQSISQNKCSLNRQLQSSSVHWRQGSWAVIGPDWTGVSQTTAKEKESKCVRLYWTERGVLGNKESICTCSLYPEIWPAFDLTPRPQTLWNSERQRDERNVIATNQDVCHVLICYSIPEGHTVVGYAVCLLITTDSKMHQDGLVLTTIAMLYRFKQSKI